jgi:hypothetical protein
MRRIIFAFRVFGMSSMKITSRGASALPRSRATFSFNSAASAIWPLPDQFGSFFQNAKTNERFALDGIGDTDSCGFTHGRMRDED